MTDTESQSLNEFLGITGQRKWPRWAKWAIIAVVLIVLLLLLRSCFSGGEAVQYATTAVKRGDMQVHVTATGNLEPINQVSVGSEISGLIDKVYVDDNDKVSKGQTLAQIDPERLKDAINSSKAALASARANVQQMLATAAQTKAQLAREEDVARMSGGKVPAKTELDSARADYQRGVANVAAARANVQQAAAQLSTDQTNLYKATIRSPVNGVVLSREIEPGQTVAASFSTPTLFLIAESLSTMELKAKVDEADVGQVKPGQPASFTVDAFPGRTFPAIIKRVNVGSNSATTTSTTSTTSSSSVVSYDAILNVSNSDLILRPGMTATATIIVSREQNALLVPNAALRFTPSNPKAVKGGGSFMPLPRGPRSGKTQEVEIGRGAHRTVYVLGDDGKLTAHDVVVGATNGSDTIVSGSSLKPGMKVVTGELASGQ